MQLSPKHLVIGLIVAVFVAIGCFIFIGIHDSLEAEHTLHANRLVFDVVIAYVEKNSGEWPESWTALEKVAPNQQGGGWIWPGDRSKIEECVYIDFDTTSQRVLEKGVAGFDAITQRGPYYPRYDYDIERLLEAIKKNTK